MPTHVPTPEQVAPGAPFVQLYLELSDGKFVKLAMWKYLQKLQHKIFAHGELGEVDITLFDQEFMYLEKFVVGGTGRGYLQYGWYNGPLTKLREFIVMSYQPEFLAHGLRLNLKLSDKQVVNNVEQWNRSFPPALGTKYPVRISDIVKSIMKEDGFSKFDIEPTTPLKENPETNDVEFRQTGVNNWHFITVSLCPKAKSASTGQTGYRFTVTDDTVIFKPLPQSPEYKREYIFARDQYGTVKSWAPQINGMVFLAQGGGELVCAGYDPATKKPIYRVVDLESATKLKIANKTIDKKVKAHTGRHASLPFNSLAKVDAWAENKYTRARESVVTARLEVLGDPKLFPLDYVKVTALLTDGSPHYTSGGYYVNEVVNTITPGSFTTEMMLISDGTGLGDKNKGIPVDDSNADDGSVDEKFLEAVSEVLEQ